MRFIWCCTVFLVACTNDTFTSDGGADGGDASNEAASDAPTNDGTIGSEGGSGDASNVDLFQCNTIKCSKPDVCCASADWDTPTCAVSSQEGTTTCVDFLECNDGRDCTGAQICCGVIDVNQANMIVSAKCALTCSALAQVRLCGSADKGTVAANCVQPANNCAVGSPSWLYTCQP